MCPKAAHRSAQTGVSGPLLAVWFAWAVVTTGYVVKEAHLPATDVFLFKDAGVNLATEGRFVTSNLPHMPPDKELIFAYYPPVFPFLFGMWSKLAGVGLKQSILFDQLLKGCRTFWLFLFLAPWLGPALKSQGQKWVARSILFSLFLLSLLTTDGDRPDEMALCWGLASWYFLWRGGFRWGTVFLAAGLLGLCGATSPAAGVFFAIGSGFFLWNSPLRWGQLVCLGLGAAGTFLLCNLPIHLADPEAFSRFSKQVPLSTLPYLLPFIHGTTWGTFLWSLEYPLDHLRHMGVPFFILIGTSLLIRLIFFRTVKRLEFPEAFGWGAALFLPLCVCIWTLQPYYFWFSAVMLVTSSFALALEMRKQTKRALLVVGLQTAALFPFVLQEAKVFVHVWERAPGQDTASVRKRVLAFVEPKAKMAVTSDQYFTFKNRRAVSDITYVCERLNDFDYVYVTSLKTTARSRVTPIPIPCEAKQRCFTLQADFSSNTVVTLFGEETPYYVRDSSGVLYRNTGCPKPPLAKQR